MLLSQASQSQQQQQQQQQYPTDLYKAMIGAYEATDQIETVVELFNMVRVEFKPHRISPTNQMCELCNTYLSDLRSPPYQMIGQCSFLDMDITMAITRALVGSCQWDKLLQLMAVLQVRRPLCEHTAPIMSA